MPALIAELKRRNVIRMAGLKLGVPAYWRVKAYPPQCRAQGSNDFVCDPIPPFRWQVAR